MTTELPKCRVTVLQRKVHRDLVEEYVADSEGAGPCERFEDGQEFILNSPFEMPEGFCPWAWADLRREVLALAAGSNMPWMKQPGTSIMACSDWSRPVIFKLERLD